MIARQIGFLIGMSGGWLIFWGCCQIHESWSGWALDELKDIRSGAALILLGIGIIALPVLAAWALSSYIS